MLDSLNISNNYGIRTIVLCPMRKKYLINSILRQDNSGLSGIKSWVKNLALLPEGVPHFWVTHGILSLSFFHLLGIAALAHS